MKNKSIITICLLSLLLLLIVSFFIITKRESNQQETNSNKIKVIDGDTFIYKNKTIRLLCVNTPEEGDKGYEEATNFLSFLLGNQQLKIEEQGIDKYNRTLAYVYTENNLLVNKEIIDKGFGKLFIYNQTDCSRLT